MSFKGGKKKKLFIGGIILILVAAILAVSLRFCFPSGEDTDDGENGENYATLKDDVTVMDEKAYKRLSASIIHTEPIENGLRLTMSDDSVLNGLDIGDVFVLQAEAGSVFGEVFFGKIDSISTSGGNLVCDVKTPYIDEVISDPVIDSSTTLDYDGITGFSAVNGVTLEKYGASNIASGSGMSGITLLGAGQGQTDATPMETKVSVKDGAIVLTFEIDLLEILKKNGSVSYEDEITEDSPEVVKPETDINELFVFFTETGKCYHRATCRCLPDHPYITSVRVAICEEKLRPCKICKPPILWPEYTYVDNSTQDGSADKEELSIPANTSSELKLTGSVILQDLGFSITGKGGKTWKLNQGFDNLGVNVSGELIADTRLSGNFSMEVEGETTRLVLWGDEESPKAYVEGLNEKLLPLVFITYNGGSFNVKTGDTDLKAPFTVGLMLYTDLQGNITAGFESYCSYTRSLDKTIDIFKSGKFVAKANRTNAQNGANVDFGLTAEASAEVDFQMLSASLMLYMGNMNVLELGLVTAGVEAEGAFAFDSKLWEQGTGGFDAQAEITAYIEMFDLDFRLKYHSWDEALSADPDPLFRLEIFHAEYEYSYQPEDPDAPAGPDYPADPDDQWETIIGSDGLEYSFPAIPNPDFYIVSGIGSFKGTDLVIPAAYNGLEVYGIGERAFENCTQLRSVTISDGICWIDPYAFSGCTSLEEIFLSDTMKGIAVDRGAFMNCSSLKNIDMSNMTRIEENTFSGCSSLVSITLSNELREIGHFAFEGCDSLKTVYFYGTEDDWGWVSFTDDNEVLYFVEIVFLLEDDTSDLPEDSSDVLIFEKTILEVNFDGTYRYCYVVSGVKDRTVSSIVIPEFYDGLEVMGIGNIAFSLCENLTSIYIPDSIRWIGESAFGGCRSLVEIDLPDGIVTVGDAAFYGCESLVSISLPSVYEVGESAFENCINLTTVYVSGSLGDIKRNTFANCYSLNTVYFDGTQEQLLSLPVDYIGNDVLYYVDVICVRTGADPNWKYDEVTGTLTISGSGDMDDYWWDYGDVPPWFDIMFSGGVRHIVIEEGITKIGTECFVYSSIESVTIPRSVNYIRFGAFSFVDTVYYEGTEAEWNTIEIEANESLTDAYMIFLG